MASLAEMDEEDNDVEEEGEEDDNNFFVSPVQIAFLRKEASKRESNKRLFKYNLPSSSDVDDDDHHDSNDTTTSTSSTNSSSGLEITMDTINTICNIFHQHEILELRGISKQNKKLVHYIAHAIANTIEDTINKPVVVVDIKGHAVRYYCPWEDDSEDEAEDEEDDGENNNNNEQQQQRVGKRIELRTKYRPGQWIRKAKPRRNNRGQIVTDEYGNSRY
jgi:FtsZ-interacting cell division protein YlmF